MNTLASENFGNLVGKTFLSADWVEAVVCQLREGLPCQRHLDVPKGLELTGYITKNKLSLQLFPMFDSKDDVTGIQGFKCNILIGSSINVCLFMSQKRIEFCGF